MANDSQASCIWLNLYWLLSSQNYLQHHLQVNLCFLLLTNGSRSGYLEGCVWAFAQAQPQCLPCWYLYHVNARSGTAKV